MMQMDACSRCFFFHRLDALIYPYASTKMGDDLHWNELTQIRCPVSNKLSLHTFMLQFGIVDETLFMLHTVGNT